MQSYKCDKCGAEIIINNEISFTKCLYCGNSIAIVKDNEKKLNIKEIIPFSIDKEDVIKYYKKYYGGEVLDAKKVYIPIRFCDYEFDYLIDYNYYIQTDSERITTRKYYDQEDLLDGYMENEVIFGDTKVNKVLFEGLFDDIKDERLKFDYAILNDVSIECSNLNEEDIKEKLMKKVRTFSISEIFKKCRRGNVTRVFNENYFISDVHLEDFSTLIPIYVVKNKKGLIYNMPGTQRIYNMVNKKRIIEIVKKTTIFSIIAAIIILPFSNWFLLYYKQYDEFRFNNTYLKSNIIIVSIIVWLIITFIIYYTLKKKSADTVNNKVKNNYNYSRHVISHVKVK